LDQQHQRLLPAEITSLRGDHRGDAFLHDVQFSADGNLFQPDRRYHLAGHVRIVEPVGVANEFVWDQLEVLAAERVTVPRAEIRERHLVSAAEFRFQMMHLAREPVRR
jgi:hypothetical protein